VALPACEAVIEHVPAVRKVAVGPEIAQTAGVVEVKLTVKFEVADATRVSGVPTV
jgi:hypothetical protein